MRDLSRRSKFRFENAIDALCLYDVDFPAGPIGDSAEFEFASPFGCVCDLVGVGFEGLGGVGEEREVCFWVGGDV